MRSSIVYLLFAFAALAGVSTTAEARRYEGNSSGWERSSYSSAHRSHRGKQAHKASRKRYAHKTRRPRVASRRSYETTAYSAGSYSSGYHSAGPRPGRWCGWWMRTQRGGGPELNLARNWARWGSNAGGPQVGAVVVWRGHVGEITGRAANGQWIVRSGNDGGRVRERARSVAGAIAFRTG
jgi:hypothetical protein